MRQPAAQPSGVCPPTTEPNVRRETRLMLSREVHLAPLPYIATCHRPSPSSPLASPPLASQPASPFFSSQVQTMQLRRARPSFWTVGQDLVSTLRARRWPAARKDAKLFLSRSLRHAACMRRDGCDSIGELAHDVLWEIRALETAELLSRAQQLVIRSLRKYL